MMIIEIILNVYHVRTLSQSIESFCFVVLFVYQMKERESVFYDTMVWFFEFYLLLLFVVVVVFGGSILVIEFVTRLVSPQSIPKLKCLMWHFRSFESWHNFRKPAKLFRIFDSPCSSPPTLVRVLIARKQEARRMPMLGRRRSRRTVALHNL